MDISPRLLDWAISGVPVYIRRRPADGVAYATVHDFSKFVTEAPIETLRIRVPDIAPTDWDATKHPSVVAALAKLNVDTTGDLM